MAHVARTRHNSELPGSDSCHMRSMTHRFLLLALGASLVLAGCGESKDEPAAADPSSAALAVSLAPVEARSIDRVVVAAGPVAPWEEMLLGVELSGLRVTALNVDVSDEVRQGDVLIELDHRTLDAELAQAVAADREAQAGIVLAETNLARGVALSEKQLISARDLDELRAGLVQAQARGATARAQRDAAQLRRSFAELRAPQPGVVSRRMVQPGQVVSSGDALLHLIRDGRLEWRAELAEADLARVREGARVELVAADGTTVIGAVRAVTPGLDTGTRTGWAYVDLPEPGSLKPGAYVEGRIETGRATATMVPAQAIVERDGYTYAFTVDGDNVAKRVRVRTGTADGAYVEVVDGLAAGDTVVARGAGFLSDGDRVRVVAAPARTAQAAR